MLPRPLLLLAVLRLAAASSPIVADALGGGRVAFSRSQARAISEDMLHVLDLEPAPPPPRRALRGSAAGPAFMRDVYRELQASHAPPRRPDPARPLRRRYNVSAWTESALFAADLIVSVAQDDSSASSWDERQRRLVFRFDHLQSQRRLSVLGAELRLFRHEFAYSGERMHLLLHRMSAAGGVPHVAETSVTELASGQTGWLEVNITAFVREWMRRPEDNGGVYVRLLNARGLDLPPDLLGLETRPGQPFSPFVVASFSEGEQVGGRRVRRSAPRYRSQGKWKARSHYRSALGYSKTCARRELRVDFKDLRWDEWVIAPQVYSAFYCAGECSFPLTQSANITNHSIVQTLLSMGYSKGRRSRIPPPCCVPIELKSMKMLYFDREQRVVLRTYHNMVVQSCGCH